MTVTADRGPAIVQRNEPVYPAQALRERVEGNVVVKVEIAEDGSVRSVVAVSGPDLLQSAATEAVRGWRFEARAAEAKIEVPFALPRP